MNKTPVLSLHELELFRQERLLFTQLNENVFAGDIIQVQGPNGAGKSSLLRVIAGIVLPSSGFVSCNDSRVAEDIESFHRQLLFIGHQPGVKAELTAKENLSLMLSLHGEAYTDAVLDQLLDTVGLLGFEDVQAAHLSAGQQRRIALARLWSQPSPPLWILDEPFTAIDKQGVKELEGKILEHANSGGSVIFTTHQAHQFTSERIKVITLDYNIE